MCKCLLLKISFILLCYNLGLSFALGQELTDPTRPPGVKDSTHGINKQAPGWILTSTLIAHGRRNAIINGKLVTIGQRINQAKVLSIQPNEVWLLHKQKRFLIKLLAQNIKDFSTTAAK